MTQSTIRPKEIEIERLGNTAIVYLRKDIQSVEDENGAYYEYDERRIESTWFSTIEKHVADNFNSWWGIAPEPAPPTLEQRVEVVESEVASVTEIVDALFGGGE